MGYIEEKAARAKALVGKRVQIPVHYDIMRGACFGRVTKVGKDGAYVYVRLDHPQAKRSRLGQWHSADGVRKMSRYPSQEVARINQQFAETPAERNERLRQARHKRTLETLWRLIADLSDDLRDEGCDWSSDGLEQMRRRVANALPPDMCPDWLARYRDPAVTGGAP